MEANGKIKVTVEKGNLTYDACFFGKMNPWFYAYLSENRKNNYKSKACIHGGKFPIWNETFSFELHNEKFLKIEICHEKELIGTVEIFIANIIEKSKYKGQHAILFDGQVRGNIIGNFAYEPEIKINSTMLSPALNTNFIGVNPNCQNAIHNNYKLVIPQNNISFAPNSCGDTSAINVYPNLDNIYDKNQFNSNFPQKLNEINSNAYIQNNMTNNTYCLSNTSNCGNNRNILNPLSFNNINLGSYSNTHNNGINTDVNINPQIGLQANSLTDISNNQVFTNTLHFFKNPVLFQGNTNSIWLYNFHNKQWQKTNNFSNEFFPKYMRAAELPDGSFFISGGDYNGQSLSLTSHFVNGSFIKRENMNNERKAHSTAYAKSSVFVFGGFGLNHTVINSCEKYDLTNGKGWKQIAQMNISRAYAATLVYGDSLIFIIGGYTGEDIEGFKETFVIEQYDILKDKFEVLKIRLPSPLYGCLSTLVSDTQILIAGGWSETTGYSRKVYTLDLLNGKYNFLQDLLQDAWSVMPAFYHNGALNIFRTGEESNCMPIHVEYPFKI